VLQCKSGGAEIRSSRFEYVDAEEEEEEEEEEVELDRCCCSFWICSGEGCKGSSEFLSSWRVLVKASFGMVETALRGEEEKLLGSWGVMVETIGRVKGAGGWRKGRERSRAGRNEIGQRVRRESVMARRGTGKARPSQKLNGQTGLVGHMRPMG